MLKNILNDFFTSLAGFFTDLLETNDIIYATNKNDRKLHLSIFVLVLLILLLFY